MALAAAAGLLGFAIFWFWVSTRQFAWPVRAVFWAFGGACVYGAVHFLIQANAGVIDLIGRSLQQAGDPIRWAVSGNWPIIQSALSQFIVVALAATAAFGLLALIAFTPGEGVERMTRPMLLILLGALCGGFFALTIVAAGFGGQLDRSVFATIMKAEDVIDGDTLRMGDVSLRLYGIDAPEAEQYCLGDPPGGEDCGDRATQALTVLVKNRLVVCSHPTFAENPAPSADHLRETFGRPLVSCIVYFAADQPHNLGALMVAQGYADLYRPSEGAAEPPAPALDENFTLGCTLKPSAWRRDRALRAAFEDAARSGDVSAIPQSALMGACPQAQVQASRRR